jgi:hypothetical protein
MKGPLQSMIHREAGCSEDVIRIVEENEEFFYIQHDTALACLSLTLQGVSRIRIRHSLALSSITNYDHVTTTYIVETPESRESGLSPRSCVFPSEKAISWRVSSVT